MNQHVKDVLEAEPPVAPTSEKPGPLLAALWEALAAAAAIGKELSPLELIEGLAMLIDMDRYKQQLRIYNALKADAEREKTWQELRKAAGPKLTIDKSK